MAESLLIAQKLRRAFSDEELISVVRKSSDVTNLNKYIKGAADKRALEVAIDNYDREKRGMKKYSFPIKPRGRAVAEISQAVKRTNLESLPPSFLHFAFLNFLTGIHAKLLVDFLSYLGIKCDSTGRITDSCEIDQKYKAPHALDDLLAQLSLKYGSKAVFQYFVALDAFQSGFSFVSFYFDQLEEWCEDAYKNEVSDAVVNENVDVLESDVISNVLKTEAVSENDAEENTSDDEPSQLNDDSKLEANHESDPLSIKWVRLCSDFEKVVAALKLGVIPDPSDFVPVWQDVYSEVQARLDAVGLEGSASLAQLKYAEAKRRYLEVMEPLKKLLSIRSTSPKNVSLAETIKRDIRALIDALPDDGLQLHQNRVTAYSNLIFLVERSQHGFANLEIEDIYKKIESELGSSIALAAVVGSFTLDEEKVKAPLTSDDKVIEHTDPNSLDLTSSTVTSESETPSPGRVLIPDSVDVSIEGSEGSSVIPIADEGQDSHHQNLPIHKPSFFARSFSDFRNCNWIGLSANVEPVPWQEANFCLRLNEAAEATLSTESLASVYILQRAVEELGEHPVLTTTSILEAADILQGGVPRTRPSRLAEVNGNSSGPEIKLLLTLEALAPGEDLWSYSENIQNFLRGTSFANQTLSRTIAALISAASNQVSLISHLRRRLPVYGQDASSDASSLRRLVDGFSDTYTSLKSTSIRGLRTDHCRSAWKSFLEEYVLPISKLILIDNPEKIDADRLQAFAESLGKNAEIVFEEWEAKFEDRSKMDRDVRELSLKIFALVRQVRDTRQKNANADSIARFDLPTAAELSSLASEELSDNVEKFCKELVFSLSAVKDLSDPLTLTQKDLIRRPELALYLGLSEPLRMSAFQFDARKVPIEQIAPAAAVVLQPGYDLPNENEISQVLKDRLTGIHRLDVMAMYLGDQAINASERARFQRQFRDFGVEEADAAYQALEAAWVECDAIGSNRAVEIRVFLDEAKVLLDLVETATFGHTALLISWLQEVRKCCEVETNKVAQELRDDVAKNAPERLSQVESAIAARRFWELDSSLGTEVLERVEESRWLQWRQADSDLLNDLPRNIREIASVSGGELQELVELWFSTNPSEESRRLCRRLFYTFISGEMSTVGTPKRRTKQDALFDRELKTTRVVIDCLSVLKRLEREGHNPTFVPQLNSFKSIVILSAPLSLRAVTSPGTLATFVHSELYKDEGANASESLAVVLTPMLAPSMRGDILDEFQKRQKAFTAVLVDDNDLYRLIAKEKAPLNDIRPFLEVIFEQIPLGNPVSSPYSGQDGQHIRREMFVGREDLARKLATTSDYSRVFSGRKLGKSAFLKSVARSFDNYSLPSKNTLHVLFISIAGGDSEKYIESRVVAELHAKFPSLFEANSKQVDLDLIDCINYIIKTQPKSSLLLLLDEADSFVEEQLRSYDRNREKCLSFRLMKEVSQHTDQNDLPRVRVVFSGYRVTNTREGAWANAGGVLILNPLETNEASKLIEGPLARLGIDVSSQSRFIAKRCGNQPAILNRFGDTLIKYLRNTRLHSRKSVVKVESSHVGAAFNDPSIAAEIRTVMFNNFQGDAAGQVIFAATLLAFSKLAPGLELSDAPRAILEQIVLIDSDLNWLEKRDPSLTGEIEHYLNDFADRKLVTNRAVRGLLLCRLKVGHSMPILLAGDLPGQIRKAITSLRDDQNASTSPLRCVFPDAQLDALRKAFETDEKVTAVVVTGCWRSALQDARVGIADRIGISPLSVGRYKGTDKFVAVIDTSTVEFEELLATSAEKHLVVGGADVARRMLQLRLSSAASNIHWQSLSRVPELGSKWWFEQLRRFHFQFPGAAREIADCTGQIPLLLQRFDDLMTQSFAEEEEISHSSFQKVKQDFLMGFDVIAEDLQNGDAAVRLERRELEVLVLLCVMAKEYETLRLPEDFTDELWKDTNASKILRIDGPRESDSVAIELIEQLGLIKVDPEKGVIYDDGRPDPIFVIADRISNVL